MAAKRSKQISPIGFIPGEKLRYTFYNPREEGSKTVRVTSYTYDSTGNLLKQTDPVEIQPGQGYTCDLNRDDLPVPGERRRNPAKWGLLHRYGFGFR